MLARSLVGISVRWTSSYPPLRKTALPSAVRTLRTHCDSPSMDARYRCPSTTVMTSGNETILPDFRPITSNATTPSGEILFDAEFAIPRLRILAIQFGLFPLYNHSLRPQNICVRTVFTL